MVEKNKNFITSEFDRVKNISGYVGMAIMLSATMVSMAETASREAHSVVLTLQPSYAYANYENNQPTSFQTQGDEQIRRGGGREEIRHTSASYGAVQRSHATSGKV